MGTPALGSLVKSGTWLYGGLVPSEVEIYRSEIAHGSGDYEDDPTIAEDVERVVSHAVP